MREFTFLSCEREFHIRGKVPDAKRFTILTRFVKSYYFDTFFDFFFITFIYDKRCLQAANC